MVQENYTAPRIVLVASGVDHDKLLEYAEPLLSDLPKAAGPPAPKPIYTGGDFRRQGDSGVCIDNYQDNFSPYFRFMSLSMNVDFQN